jgi:5-methylcytosine-specific restriction endonuclease McrA
MPHKDPLRKREYMRAYSKKNRVRDRARTSAATMDWQKRNWDRKLAAAKRYRDRHRQRVRESWLKTYRTSKGYQASKRIQSKQWKDAHPEYQKFYNHIRNARARANGGDCTPAQWKARGEFYGWRCAYCLIQLSLETAEVDHVIPVIRGGSNWPSNLVPACRSCNATKHAKLILPMWLRKESAA